MWLRREHFVQDQKVKGAEDAMDAFAEDHVVLTAHMHMARFSRENTERDLAAVKAQREAVRSDWQRKLQDCRKEVASPPLFWHTMGLDTPAHGKKATALKLILSRFYPQSCSLNVRDNLRSHLSAENAAPWL